MCESFKERRKDDSHPKIHFNLFKSFTSLSLKYFGIFDDDDDVAILHYDIPRFFSDSGSPFFLALRSGVRMRLLQSLVTTVSMSPVTWVSPASASGVFKGVRGKLTRVALCL